MKLFNQETKKSCVALADGGTLQNPLATSQRLPSIVSRVTLAFGGMVLLGGVSGANWGLTRLQAEIVPRLTEVLGQALNRPIQLGQVEQMSWTGLRLGRSVIPATATDPDTLTVEAIEVQFDPVQALKHHQLKLILTLVRPVAYIDQDKAGDWLNLDLKFDDDAKVEIDRLRLRDGTITLAPQPIVLDDDPPEPDDEPWDISDHPSQLTLRQVNGELSLRDQGEHLQFQASAQPHEQGRDQGIVKLQGDMQFATQQMKLAVQTQNLQLKSLAALIPTDFKVASGVLNADVTLQKQGDRPLTTLGKAELKDGATRIKGEPNPFGGINGQFQFQGQEVQLRQGQLRFGQIPFQLDGKIHFQKGFDLNARVPFVDAAPFMQTLELEVPFPVEGALKSDDLRLTGSFEHPILSGTADAAKPLKFDRLAMAHVKGEFSLDLGSDYLQLHRIWLQPVTGGSITTRAEVWLEEDNAKVNVEVNQIPADRLASLYQFGFADRHLGTINANAQVTVLDEEPKLIAQWRLDQGDFPAAGKVSLDRDILRLSDTAVQIGDGSLNATAELKQKRWQANLFGSNLSLDRLNPDLPGKLQGEFQVAGDLQQGLASIQAQGQTQLQLGTGHLTADLTAQQGNWQAQLAGSQIPLQPLVPQLPSFMSQQSTVAGKVNLAGSLATLNLTGTRADGQLSLTDGIGVFAQPIDAEFAWTGQQLELKKVHTDKIAIAGQITPVIQDQQIQDLGNLDLQVRVQGYDLAALPLIQSAPVALTGVINLDGKVTGTVEQPQITSDVQLDRFAIQQFQFEPLKGHLQSQPNHQIGLDLKGKQDRIALSLDSSYRPTTFSVQLDQAQAAGEWVGNLLSAQIRNFDLVKLNLAPLASIGPVRGILAGQLKANLANLTQPAVTAVVEIQQPGMGLINAVPDAAHKSDRATGTLQYREGQLVLTDAALHLGKSRCQLAGQFDTKMAQWQSQIAIDQGNFQDLLTLVPSEAWPHLLQQIAGGAAIDASLMANLTALQGQFAGQANIRSAPSGMQAAFNLRGQDWQFANYGIDQVAIANAQFDGRSLLLPSVQATGFRLGSATQAQPIDGQFGFAGQLSADAVAGQLQLNHVALPQIQQTLNLPIDLAGQVHAVATLSGRPTQPNLTGELHLDGVTVRDMPIEQAKIGFSYVDQQFHLENWQSLTAVGSSNPDPAPAH